MPHFPGMNPYLEGYLFQDLHNALANRIRALLTPLIRPRYAARLEVSTLQDTSPLEELGIIYPDVEVLKTKDSSQLNPSSLPTTPATLTLPPPRLVKVPTVEVKEAQGNRLVTCIEILSYANKRQPGAGIYQQKRDRLIKAGVHLVEIDLIRRGIWHKTACLHRRQTAQSSLACTDSIHRGTSAPRLTAKSLTS